VSNSLRSDLAIDALEMAIYARKAEELAGLVHHIDRLNSPSSSRFATPNDLTIYRSINALAESFNGLYKTELIYHEGPWKSADDVEWATLAYVDWSNNRRLHGEIDMMPPAEFEERHYRQTTAA